MDIASLKQLEVLMVLGYALNDADAQVLASSPSLKRIILRGTAVSAIGEAHLAESLSDRIVYRN